jgi:heme-degrading monooxygenase HmoA
MIVVMNAVRVSGEQAEQFEQAFLSRPRLLDKVDGFIRFELLRPQGRDEYLVVTHWRDHDAFQGWLKSDAFREAHKDLRNAELAHASEVRTYEVIDTELPAEAEEVAA